MYNEASTVLDSFKVVPLFADKPASAVCLVTFSLNVDVWLCYCNEFGDLAML